MKIDPSVYTAPGAHIVGNVTIGAGSSVWYNTVIRADEAPIIIGNNTNIQDLVTVHVGMDQPAVLGDGVTVGHNAIVHGCTVEDNVIVGMGAILLNGSHIRRNSIVGAGALVTQGKDFPEGSLILGSPAKVVRSLTPEEIEGIRRNAEVYVKLAAEQAGK